MKEQDTPIECMKCGAPIEILPGEEYATCQYCGASYTVSDLINESEELKIEKLRQESNRENLEFMRERDKIQLKEMRAKNFHASFFSKLLILFAFITLFFGGFAFSDHMIISGVIAVIQTILFVLAWLLGCQIIPEKQTYHHKALVVVAILLAIPFLMGVEQGYPNMDPEKIVWEEFAMSDFLPAPDNTKTGNIFLNKKNHLDLKLYKLSMQDYKDYVEKCKTAGFTRESTSDDLSYRAFNENGYCLDLFYFKSDKALRLRLDEPMEMTELLWPDNFNLPKPDSQVGKIDWMQGNEFDIYVGDMPVSKFNTYCNSLVQAGFDKNSNLYDDHFYGKDSQENYVNVKYDGNNIIKISYREAIK